MAICHVNCDKPLKILEHTAGVDIWDVAWNNMGTMLATCGGDRMVDLYTSQNWAPNQTSFELS